MLVAVNIQADYYTQLNHKQLLIYDTTYSTYAAHAMQYNIIPLCRSAVQLLPRFTASRLSPW